VSGWTSTRYTDNCSTVCPRKHSAWRSSRVSYGIQRLRLLSVCHPAFAPPPWDPPLGVAEGTVRWTRSTPSGSARGRPVGVIEDTEGPDQKGTLHAWLAARAHIVPPPTMRDSNGDSKALSPTVVGQRPLMREHAQNRRCGHLCWLLS
jgi:hypothetical protein